MKNLLCSKSFVLFFLCLTLMTVFLWSIPARSKVIAPSKSTPPIDDSSIPITISLSPKEIQVSEGNSGNTLVYLPVSLSRQSKERLSVKYDITSVGILAVGMIRAKGEGPNQDFVSTSGVLKFEPGETSKLIPVRIIGDTRYEPDEVFFVAISSAQQAKIQGNSRTKITILNDDRVVIGDGNFPPSPDGRPLYKPFTTYSPVYQLSVGNDTANYTQTLVIEPSGTLASMGVSTFEHSGVLFQNGGVFTSSGALKLKGGKLIGFGGANELRANVFNMGGKVNPGGASPTGTGSTATDAPGTLQVSGTYSQNQNGTLNIQIGGTPDSVVPTTGTVIPGSGTGYDKLIVTDTVTLDANTSVLKVTLLLNYTPKRGDSFQIIKCKANGRIGTFKSISWPSMPLGSGLSWTKNYAPDGVSISVE